MTGDRRLDRAIVHKMFKLAPNTLQSGLIPANLKPAVEDLTSGKYPTRIKDLAINGNDLIALNVEPRQRGIMQNQILSAVYGDVLPNEKEAQLDFIRKTLNL